MKSRKNRIVSLITAAFLLCSVIVPATRGGITARAAGFETESYTVDFKDFDLTNDGKDVYKRQAPCNRQDQQKGSPPRRGGERGGLHRLRLLRYHVSRLYY